MRLDRPVRRRRVHAARHELRAVGGRQRRIPVEQLCEPAETDAVDDAAGQGLHDRRQAAQPARADPRAHRGGEPEPDARQQRGAGPHCRRRIEHLDPRAADDGRGRLAERRVHRRGQPVRLPHHGAGEQPGDAARSVQRVAGLARDRARSRLHAEGAGHGHDDPHGCQQHDADRQVHLHGWRVRVPRQRRIDAVFHDRRVRPVSGGECRDEENLTLRGGRRRRAGAARGARAERRQQRRHAGLVPRDAAAEQHADDDQRRTDTDQHAAAAAAVVHVAGHRAAHERRRHRRPDGQPLPDRPHRGHVGGRRAAGVQGVGPGHDQAARPGRRARHAEHRARVGQPDREKRAAVEPGRAAAVLLRAGHREVPAVPRPRRVVQLVQRPSAQHELHQADPGQPRRDSRGGRGQAGYDIGGGEGVVVMAAGVQRRPAVQHDRAFRADCVGDVHPAEDDVDGDDQGGRRHGALGIEIGPEGRPDHQLRRDDVQVLSAATDDAWHAAAKSQAKKSPPKRRAESISEETWRRQVQF
ncbi:hypothetical protein BCEP4_940023 [Burkholderia cepacia]|nr:hypothetical protein BCEP4_940023 [Burkholderia cepacia]